MTPRPLPGSRPSFRFQRNRAGRSHAARVLLRAQNSLRSFRGPARKPGTFRSAKKHKFQRQQLANLCFFNASLRWPRNPACGPRAGLAPGWPRHAPAGAERQTRWRFPSRAKQQELHSRAHTLRVCRKTGFGIGRPTSRLPLPGKLFLRSGLSARTRCEMLACVRA